TDYNDNMSGTVVISSGTTSVDIPISVIDDLLIDPNETITMSLESASNNFDVTDASATLVISDDEPATFVPIYDIQGSSDTPNRLDEEVNTRGIVTATYFEDGQMGGFFIQDPSGDSNAQTSDGIYVFCGSNLCKTVAVGDLVSVDARVREYFGLTELSGVSDLSIISNDNSLPTPVDIVLDGSAKNLESVEGMLVRFPETLYVTDVYEAGTKGEITLSSDAPLVQPTQLIDPNDTPATGVNATGMANVAAIQQQMTANTNNRIRLDDGDNGQEFTALPFFFSNEGTVRIGSSVSQLTGAMHYSSGEYKIEPLLGNHPLQSQTFTHIPRPAVPTLDNADVIVAAFNVLNYFNGDGQGGGFPTRRGAQTLEELQRQEAKIVAALSMMNADVVGLNEMEKDGTGTHSALRQLVDRLNDQLGAGTYAFIDDSHLTHTSDIIRNAIIYRPDKVTPVGAAMVSANTNRVYSRKPVAQRFRINSDQTEFVYIINHLKAKSCNNASDADLDLND
ncbi:MAG: ExeM/NucH family extracellular endonuclease, partial [Bacteroidota bacterium]